MKLGAIHAARPDTVARLSARTSLVETPIPDWFTKWAADGDDLGNGSFGDCVPAADCQIVRLWGGMADRALALGRYQRLTGFDPLTGLPDNGTDTAADLSSWCAAPILDMTGKPWPCYWASVDHTDKVEIRQALARFPLLITVDCPDPDVYPPEQWVQSPRAGWKPSGAHRIILGNLTPSGWVVRSWGLDYYVHPDLMAQWLLAVDVPIPHPVSAPVELQWNDVDYAALERDLAGLTV